MVNPIRFGGLASGIDTDLMIKDLMKIERMKADKLYQDRQILQWQQEEYRNINALMLSFRNTAFDMRLDGTLMKNKTSLTKDTAADVTAGVNVRKGSYTLKVKELAARAVKESGGSLSGAIEGTFIGGKVGIGSTNNGFYITLDGIKKAITISEGEYDVEELAEEIQTQVDLAFGKDRIEVGIKEGRLTFQPAGDYKPELVLNSGEKDALKTLGFRDGDSFKVDINAPLKNIADRLSHHPFAGDNDIIRFRINGQEFYYDFSTKGSDRNKSLASIIEDINKRAGIGVEAYYDNITDKLVIESKDYGVGAEVSIENLRGNFFGSEGMLQIEEGRSCGKDAEIELNGVLINKNSNKFSIEGLNFNLKDISENTIKIGIERDIEGAFDAIKGFVEKYNELIERINGKIYEERFRDYPPLTDEQREVMNDKEIELWEEKAKSGILRNDSILTSIVSEMRTLMYQVIGEAGAEYRTLTSIGIGTLDYREFGKLHIDENKLREALEKDLEGVASLFNRSGETEEEKGLAYRLYDRVNSGITWLSERAGSSVSVSSYDGSLMGLRIKDMDKRIDRMEDYLSKVEERYWKQFTAMETAMERMNSQSMWLMQQFNLWNN